MYYKLDFFPFVTKINFWRIIIFLFWKITKQSEENVDDDLDDQLEAQWALQDQIHHKCKMRDDPEKKLKEWKEKYE